MPLGLFSLRLTFEISKSESLRDVSVTRIGDTFPTVFRRLISRTLSQAEVDMSTIQIMSTIFVAQQVYLVVRHSFLVAWRLHCTVTVKLIDTA